METIERNWMKEIGDNWKVEGGIDESLEDNGSHVWFNGIEGIDRF